jgi:hypothetical protein
MAKATRVHSTPRRTASKIKVKKSAKSASAESEEQRNLRHGKAFRDLENPMLNLFCMAEIAGDVVIDRISEDQQEIMHFAVYRLCDMVRDLRAKYRADLRAVPSRGKAVQS